MGVGWGTRENNIEKKRSVKQTQTDHAVYLCPTIELPTQKISLYLQYSEATAQRNLLTDACPAHYVPTAVSVWEDFQMQNAPCYYITLPFCLVIHTPLLRLVNPHCLGFRNCFFNFLSKQ